MTDDIVASVVRQWHAVNPELDTGPMELIGRITAARPFSSRRRTPRCAPPD